MRIPITEGVFSEQWDGDMVIQALLANTYRFHEIVDRPLSVNPGTYCGDFPQLTIAERIRQWEEGSDRYFPDAYHNFGRALPGLILAYRNFPKRRDGDLLVAVYVTELNDFIGFNIFAEEDSAQAENAVSEYAVTLFQSYRTQIREQAGIF